MKFIILIAAVAAFAHNCVASVQHGDISAPNNNYRVDWAVNCEAREIAFKLTAETKGYVGFGIQVGPKREMVISGVMDDGMLYFYNKFTHPRANTTVSNDANERPPVENSLSDEEIPKWQLIDGRENDTHTIMKLKRRFVASDFETNTTRLSWAYGDSDEISDHGRTNRGYLEPNIKFCNVPDSRKKNTQRVTLSENLYDLEWSVDTEKKEIEFLATVKTKGYVGFGLSKDGKLSGSDLVFGGVHSNGSNYLTSFQGAGHGQGPPVEDERKHWELISAVENETSTILRFKRKLDTGDDDDIVITDSNLYLHWAVGYLDGFGDNGARRGSLFINLLSDNSQKTEEGYKNLLLKLHRMLLKDSSAAAL